MEVIVWSWSLQTGPLVGDDAQALLSDDERARQRSFVSPELRRRFGAARAGLRTLLGRHLDRDPRRLSFATNEFGKPRLAGDGRVHFNLSHCEERAVLAISDEEEDTITKFLSERAEPFLRPVARDPLRQSFISYGVSGTPTVLLVDADGVIRHRQVGYTADKGLSVQGWNRPVQ